MLIRRKGTPPSPSNELVSAVFEPRDGHTCDEVMAKLEELGAVEIEALSDDYISARAAPLALSKMEPLAFVTEKPPHEFH